MAPRYDTFDIAVGAGLLGLGVAAYLVFRSRAAHAGVAQSFLRTPQRVLVIGDSLAVGMMPTFAGLAQRDGHEFYGKGCPMGATGGSACTAVTGSSTPQWARDAWIGSALAASRPSLVLISLGTNDFKGGASYAPTVRSAAQSIAAKIRAAGALPIWIDPLRMPFEDSAMARDAWRNSGAIAFDSSQLDFKRAGDGVHLTPAGYQGWAEQVWSWLAGSIGGARG